MRSSLIPAVFLIVFILLSVTGTGAPPALIISETGSLAEKVRLLTEGQFGSNTNRFRVPTPEERRDWDSLVRLVAQGRTARAASLLKRLGYPYRLVSFRETTNGREYLLLEESPRMYGWGIFVFDPATKNPLVLEVPHPLSDSGTELQGAEALIETGARALVISGVHRQANRKLSPCTHATENSDYRESDPAHNVNTMFHQTHETLVQIYPETVAVQLHGMRERDVCPNVFLSTGTAAVTKNAERFLRCLKDRGVEATLYDGTVSCPLIASTNVQGRFSNGKRGDACGSYAEASPEPGLFIHAEQEPGIREGPASWKPVIEALRCAFPAAAR